MARLRELDRRRCRCGARAHVEVIADMGRRIGIFCGRCAPRELRKLQALEANAAASCGFTA